MRCRNRPGGTVAATWSVRLGQPEANGAWRDANRAGTR
jgi:hypothetical protein